MLYPEFGTASLDVSALCRNEAGCNLHSVTLHGRCETWESRIYMFNCRLNYMRYMDVNARRNKDNFQENEQRYTAIHCSSQDEYCGHAKHRDLFGVCFVFGLLLFLAGASILLDFPLSFLGRRLCLLGSLVCSFCILQNNNNNNNHRVFQLMMSEVHAGLVLQTSCSIICFFSKHTRY